jgi:hypothetical protein
MSTRAQQARLLRNEDFRDQVTGALLFAASQVLNEAPEASNHEDRIRWANAIIADPQGQTAFLVTGMLTNATIAGAAGDPSAISDNDVDYVVASLFDAYADQYALQTTLGARLNLGH